MPSLKELRKRKASVQSTRKITSAMKMLSAAKLKKAQNQVESGRPYSDMMARVLGSLLEKTTAFKMPPPLLVGRGKSENYLLLVIASDRGLCGGFNNNVYRMAKSISLDLLGAKRTIKMLCVGRRVRDSLKSEFRDHILETLPAFARPSFSDASIIARKIITLFEEGEIDVCQLIYSDFVSSMTQKVSVHQLIPFTPIKKREKEIVEEAFEKKLADRFIYEPDEEQVLNELLPRNIAVQIYRALMENAASEHGARMTAMDNATRNASDMIKALELKYNRTRQAYITKELIEIISGAEAL